MLFTFKCECGNMLEAELTVTSSGSNQTFEHPGDAAEWFMEKEVHCDPDETGCGIVWDDEKLTEKYSDRIQQEIFEAKVDRLEEDYEA